MTRRKIITDLREALDSVDITSDLRLVLIHAIEYLQREPSCEKKDYRERYEKLTQSNTFKSSYCDKSLGKEDSASEDLEEVADNYAQQHNELLGFDCDCEPIQTGPEIKKAVIFGAEWRKQQMMKNAVSGYVSLCHDYPRRRSLVAVADSLTNFEYAEKVKIIICKTEQQ